MINTKCENFHSGETLSKTLCNKTAGTLVPIHAELQKKKKKRVSNSHRTLIGYCYERRI